MKKGGYKTIRIIKHQLYLKPNGRNVTMHALLSPMALVL